MFLQALQQYETRRDWFESRGVGKEDAIIETINGSYPDLLVANDVDDILDCADVILEEPNMCTRLIGELQMQGLANAARQLAEQRGLEGDELKRTLLLMTSGQYAQTWHPFLPACVSSTVDIVMHDMGQARNEKRTAPAAQTESRKRGRGVGRSKARRSKARRSEARRSKARRSKARRSKARRSEARRSKARRSKARRSKAHRSRRK